jgi:16S rRNA (uracil1498-N3)-methyltransferase
VVHVDAPGPILAVALAVPKGDRMDWAVQKLTEIGVDRIVALRAERSVVVWDQARAQRQRRRLEAVARQAAMQSRRLRPPVLDGPLVPAAVADTLGLGTVMAEPGVAAPLTLGPTGTVVLVGPEGGWAPAELDACPARADLGPSILRTETAAVVAATLLVALRAGTVRPGA